MLLGQGSMFPGSWLLILRAHRNLKMQQNCGIGGKATVQVRMVTLLRLTADGSELKVLVAKLDKEASIPGTHKAKGENQLCGLSSDF